MTIYATICTCTRIQFIITDKTQQFDILCLILLLICLYPLLHSLYSMTHYLISSYNESINQFTLLLFIGWMKNEPIFDFIFTILHCSHVKRLQLSMYHYLLIIEALLILNTYSYSMTRFLWIKISNLFFFYSLWWSRSRLLCIHQRLYLIPSIYPPHHSGGHLCQVCRLFE